MTNTFTPARIVIGIPTLDRPGIVDQTVRAFASQKRLPDLVVVSGHKSGDFGTLERADAGFPIALVTGPKGSCAQRNRILDMLEPGDILLFLDDDFLIAPDFLAQLETLFADHPDIVIATGQVVADGILGPGIGVEEAQRLLDRALKSPPGTGLRDVRNGYGCNMAVRMATIKAQGLRFDEALPLYAWFEDVDFSVRAAGFGRVVEVDALRGVHLGTKTGRSPGLRVGYSQVANLHYLYRKGTMGGRATLSRIGRNLLSNLFHTVRPQGWIDHRGRLKGNWMAIADLLRGRCDPARITRL